MAAEKPVIVFVPGAWHIPAHYEPAAKLLRDAGYEVALLRHPSVSVSRDPGNIMNKDARVVADNIRKFVGTTQGPGQEAVLVMHSYGGISGSEAAAIVSEELRSNPDPNAGRITRLVFLAAHVLEKGMSFESSGRDISDLDINNVRPALSNCIVSPTDTNVPRTGCVSVPTHMKDTTATFRVRTLSLLLRTSLAHKLHLEHIASCMKATWECVIYLLTPGQHASTNGDLRFHNTNILCWLERLWNPLYVHQMPTGCWSHW